MLQLRKSMLVGLIALVAPLLAARESRADLGKINCTVTKLQIDNNQRLAIWCSGDGNIYYAASYQIGTGCPVQTADTLKAFENMTQEALLSGRLIDFNYNNTCGPFTVDWGFALH